MNFAQAKIECQRWLDYLERQKERSLSIQQIATDVRTNRCTQDEGKRRLKAIDGGGVTVFDGAKLSDAVKFLIKNL